MGRDFKAMATVKTGAAVPSSLLASMEIAQIARLRHEPVFQIHMGKRRDSHV